jgi:hypothetical protein
MPLSFVFCDNRDDVPIESALCTQNRIPDRPDVSYKRCVPIYRVPKRRAEPCTKDSIHTWDGPKVFL